MSTHNVVSITVSEITIPAYNPRKTLNSDSVAELAESMRERGLLQPIMVRMRTMKDRADSRGSYELVFGQRRLAAAKLLGWETVNALVMRGDLSDEEVQQAAVVENLQREQLPPLEEAEAIAGLLKGGMPEREVAARIGMRLPTLRARLKLLDLCPAAREALVAQRISVAGAVTLSRLESHEAQAAVITEALRYAAGMVSADIVDRLADRHRAFLSSARFPIMDNALVLHAPVCPACHKRSSAQAALFGDSPVEADDACLDVTCWNAKTEAYARRLVSDWEKMGARHAAEKDTKDFYRWDNLEEEVPEWHAAHKMAKECGAKTWMDLLQSEGRRVPAAIFKPQHAHALPTLRALREDIEKALGLEKPEADDPEGDAEDAARNEEWKKEQAEKEAERVRKSLGRGALDDPKLLAEMNPADVADLLRTDTEMDLLSMQASQEPASDELIRGVLGVMVGLVSPHGEPNVFTLARRWCTDAAIKNIKSREDALKELRHAIKVLPPRAQLHGALVEVLYAMDDQAALPLAQLFGVAEKDVAKAAAAQAKTFVEEAKKTVASAETPEGEPKKRQRRKKYAA